MSQGQKYGCLECHSGFMTAASAKSHYIETHVSKYIATSKY